VNGRAGRFVLSVAAWSILAGTPLWAHRDDYINETFVFQTLGEREFESEFWLDYAPAKDDLPSSRTYAAAFEYGVTKHWMVDGFAGWLDEAGEGFALQRLRTETRMRFGEEGDRPVDLAASFEVEYERQKDPAAGTEIEKSLLLTPRLVMSRDLPHEINVTLNLDLTRELRDHGEDRWTPGVALAARYPREAFLRYGIEAREEFGEERDALLVPQVWLSFPHEATLKFGAGIDLAGAHRQGFLRTVFEVEF